MNSNIRAIGFGRIHSNEELRPLLDRILSDPETRILIKEGDTNCGYFTQSFGDNIGIKAYAEYKGEGPLREEYYFPYGDTKLISTTTSCSVEKKQDSHAYLGMCEETGLAISLIFYITNGVEYAARAKDRRDKITGVSLTGLCTDGKVLLPVKATVRQKELALACASHQAGLIEAAKGGDEAAMEALAMDEMELTRDIADRLSSEDIYSIIDTYFMPAGMESDRYAIFGQILRVEELENTLTGEELWRMEVDSNGLHISIIMNQQDLMGFPKPGMRFKGEVWLTGRLLFEQ